MQQRCHFNNAGRSMRGSAAVHSDYTAAQSAQADLLSNKSSIVRVLDGFTISSVCHEVNSRQEGPA